MPDLIKKLQIKDGFKGRILNIPLELRETLAKWPDDLLTNPGKELDFVLVFVRSAADIAGGAPRAAGLLRDDGQLWFAYPKQSSGIKTDINRDHGWGPLDELGFRPVRQVSIDEIWSALRFREKARVR